ncbi:poly A polymerase head domain-containing protein [Colletotrichum scovillei]|uniref:Poly A polymerase head domain-containing protein n=1 Tax=Colletotrichum scovillei TaxID=1209932 RepID=A0A9P7QUK7_9PEZI|nr:poly A polymerase head domain-containing protein [Colletotrichum scovillei]KAG7045893.1 poly A polymerase head domain-containing protein [Colletotrichum scovillei]KAG7063238.1 poly A polymerase head domain-containing protein [Colletotrichum scovillei]
MLRACARPRSVLTWNRCSVPRASLYPCLMKRNFDAFVGRPSVSSPSTMTTSAAASSTSNITTANDPPTLSLTPKEQQLRDLLVDVAAFIDGAGRSPEPLVLRWAGGWVRDKLLGIESHDIDTAINAMTGYAFSLELRDYCALEEHTKKHNIGPDDMGSLHRIAANPDKSKHLETATTRMFGLDVDFVNLRKETYTQDSRNPTMEFGTAEEDALRRDATINALFYNLHTGLVEDLTGGLTDMKSRLIRTPMEPFQTFTDDPLRVLRLLRFASRLDFSIDSAATAVMADPQVLNALKLKISRERVGVEMEKMLKGKNPCMSLDLIRTLKLYEAIFTDSSDSGHPSPDLSKWKLAYNLLDRLAHDKVPRMIYDVLVTSDEAAYFAWNLAAITPYSHVMEEVPLPKARGSVPLPTLVAREGVKAPNKLCDVITAAYRHRVEILDLKQSFGAGQSRTTERGIVGMAIRKWDSHGGHWRIQVLYALLVEAIEKLPSDSPTDRAEFLSGWQKFLDHLADLDVMDAPSLTRLVDGRLLGKELGVRPDLPERYTLTDLARDLSEVEHFPPISTLSALSLCLGNAERIDQGPQDHESIAQLSSHALGLLSSSSGPLLNTDPALAEQALDVLRSLVVRFSPPLADQDLIVIATYTDRKRTWTTVNAELSAREILKRSLNDVQKQTFITSVVLEGFIRPIFSRASSSRITSTGRKAHFADDSQDRFTPGASADTEDAKSWKTTQPHAITVFSWAVEQSHVGQFRSQVVMMLEWPANH